VKAVVEIDADDPVFAGHYPGFPILPGVCLVEYVRLLDGRPLVAIESCRFLAPVFPGDELAIECHWPSPGLCRATVATGRGVAARIRLRFTGERP
jgi:3-hydroxyacyl-[acyl-carrier-protein] dehydratase